MSGVGMAQKHTGMRNTRMRKKNSGCVWTEEAIRPLAILVRKQRALSWLLLEIALTPLRHNVAEQQNPRDPGDA